MTTVVSILLSDVVSLRSRGTFQGLINIVFASGAAIGAPLGMYNPNQPYENNQAANKSSKAVFLQIVSVGDGKSILLSILSQVLTLP